MKLIQYLRVTKRFYIIGYLPYRDNFQSAVDFAKVQWVKFPSYKKNWVADPFLFSIFDNTIEILVEEMCEDEGKGRLSKLCIDKKSGKLLDKKVILDLPSHLSFRKKMGKLMYIQKIVEEEHCVFMNMIIPQISW